MTVPVLWAQCARLQAEIRKPVVNDTSWAAEDALGAVLDRIAAGMPLLTDEQLDELIGNRRRKHRERRRELSKAAPILTRSIIIDPREAAGASTDISIALRRLLSRERSIVVNLGLGYTYPEIARRLDIPTGTVKTWAFRARRKLPAGA